MIIHSNVSTCACFCRTQRQPSCNRRELVAATDPAFTEAPNEDLAHGWYKGSATCEENPIHLERLDPAAFKQRIHAVLDRGQILRNPTLEFGARYRNA